MLIIKIEAQNSGQHLFQSQSHRDVCWLEGYIAVPPEMEAAVMSCRGYCDLTIEHDVLTAVTPRPDLIPQPEERPFAEGGATWNEMAQAIAEGVNEV